MSVQRGTRPGAPRMDEPGDSGVRIAIAAVVVGAALVLSIALGIGALMPGASPAPSDTPVPTVSVAPTHSLVPTATHEAPATDEPSPSPLPTDSAVPASATPSATRTFGSSVTQQPTARPSVTPVPTSAPTPRPTARPTPRPTPRPTRTPQPTAATGDPDDLPRFPGARLMERRTGRDGDLATLRLEYQAPARLDRVRRHYRAMLRRHGWFVGDVEFHGDRWDIQANKGAREASIELREKDDGTEVRIEISWPATDLDSRRDDPDADHSGPG